MMFYLWRFDYWKRNRTNAESVPNFSPGSRWFRNAESVPNFSPDRFGFETLKAWLILAQGLL